MPGWVEKHSDVLLRLGCRHCGAQGERFSDRRIEVPNLEVEVHHRPLGAVNGRPYRDLVIGRLLEHDVDRSLGGGEYRRSM